jgi:hypothetical protein
VGRSGKAVAQGGWRAEQVDPGRVARVFFVLTEATRGPSGWAALSFVVAVLTAITGSGF